ncbi:MAG TPA: copper resistance CopC family protein [Steroidobacteraceae bacterium]|nr:copper resistance CopC family protein [Steroidobacteraceae bacterium]
MKKTIVRTCAGLLLLTYAALAVAHAHLEQATPADGSVLSHAPSSLVLRFSEPVRVTALWLQKDAGAKQKVASLPSASAPEITVPLPALSPGEYVVTWRVLSADGHVMPGSLHFTLSDGRTPPGGASGGR